MMKICSLTYSADSECFTGYMEADGQYFTIYSTPTNSSKQLMYFDFETEGYERVAAVAGKFDPYSRWLRDPIPIIELSFDELQRIHSESPYLE